jgi:TPR repeat protein
MTNNPEHRQHQRQSPRELAYFELEPNNYGMILNVSEGGFGFRAVAPVQPSDKLQFAIEFEENIRLEGKGRLEWVDQDRTRAGLRFTEVSEKFAAQIRDWLTKTNVPPAKDKQSTPDPPVFVEPDIDRKAVIEPVMERLAPPAVNRSGTLEAEQMQAQIPLVKEAASGQGLKAALPDELANTLLMSLQQEAERLVTALQKAGVESEVKLVAQQESAKALKDRIKEALRGAGQASERLEDITAALEILYQQKLSHFQSQADDLLNRHVSELDQRSKSLLEGINPRVRGPSASPYDGILVAITVALLAVLLAVALFSYHREAGRAFTWLGQRMEGESRSPAEERAPEEELSVPQEEPAGGPVLGKEARTLWGGVAKGDTSAEIALAQLYLTGKGVKESCVQAQLLLRAAADNGSGEARQKLAELDREGCKLVSRRAKTKAN